MLRNGVADMMIRVHDTGTYGAAPSAIFRPFAGRPWRPSKYGGTGSAWPSPMAVADGRDIV
ncbi:MAG: hypothetical protein ACLSF2_00985 [Butyricicoccus sp.]